MDPQAARTPEEIARAIREEGARIEPWVIDRRRHFHRHPELSLEEVRTTADIAAELDALGIPYERPLPTGLVATLAGTAPDAYAPDGAPRRRILLRADIDGLPVTERIVKEHVPGVTRVVAVNDMGGGMADLYDEYAPF